MNPVVGFLRSMAGKVFVPYLERKLARFERQLSSARALQREVLFRKIRRCRDSQFGRDHHFRSIRTIEDYRRHVPIAEYPYYYPYIKQVTEGNIEALFPRGEKILMYTLSSGTTDEPKLIPVTRQWMREYRWGWNLWGLRAFADHPALFYARLAGIAGNWDMRRTPTNVPCGMASGLSAKMQNPLLRMAYCIPPSVFTIEDATAKYYASLRLSVPENTGLFLTATPATVVNFARLGDQFRQQLIRDIHDGTLSSEFAIPAAIRREIDRRIRHPNPERARALEAIVERTGHLYPRDYWKLALVACWLGGTVGTYARHIKDYYGDVPCRDIGLLCSEGRFTIPVADGTPSGLLEVVNHYYEFIPEEEIDSTQPTVLEGHELQVGRSYFILLTTSSGLYRYNIQDVLRCTGFVGETPLLEFLHKGRRFSDMEGEKLSEYHFVKAVGEIADQLNLAITSFTAVPIRSEESNGARSAPPYYAILLEEQDVRDRATAIRFLEGIDRWLAEKNVMYQGKRSDLYLGPPRLVRIASGSFRAYDQEEIRRRGVGEDHYKHPCLVLDASFATRFPIIEEIAPAQAALPA